MQLQAARAAAADAAERHALAVVRAHTPQAFGPGNSLQQQQYDSAERQAQQYNARVVEVLALENILSKHQSTALELRQKLQAYLEQVSGVVQLSANMLEGCLKIAPNNGAPATMVSASPQN